MAIRKVLIYPDPRLREVAKPVEKVDAEVLKLIDDMFETMEQENGLGLAATQINEPWRIIVMDVSETRDNPMVLINPEIIASSGRSKIQEGCLSVPGVYECLNRADQVTVRTLNRKGETEEIQAQGLHAVCVQHEIDHLDGKLLVDQLSRLKRERIKRKLTKLKGRLM